ncbi:MAG: DNA protecting protein DprA [Candidatus Levybacteria bacterium RIFCSPHIGHO2_01_FULL_36_15]|nr:MAG: DNA protecting protein DprA [Candidatus Levybacteria bacterium RIFCSPHIGHO2_01_FULL_36_15]
MEERNFQLAFSLVPGIGPKRFAGLLRVFGDARDAWFGKYEDYKKAGIGDLTFEKFSKFRSSFDIKAYLEQLKQKKVQFVAIADNNYPENLKKIDEAPLVIFVKGDIFNIDGKKCIAVVGTRKITRYGEEVTAKLVLELVSQGFIIVSGLALGVDVLAHKTAIEENAKTIAVLGSGVDCCYPRENMFIYEKIINGSGAVVSPFPLSMQPSIGTFPARNKIISGLSIGTLVTEAGFESGALITANYARQQKRPVFAVPGPITSKQSEGTAKLLKNGAIFIQNSQDILNYLGLKTSKSKDYSGLNLDKEEKQVFNVLRSESLNINDISKKTQIQISKLSAILTSLEIKGIVKNLGAGEFSIN